MDERTVGQIEEWDSRPFEGGYDGLHSLADDGFTGAVTAAEAWLFMLNGRVIGVFNGRLDDFEHGGGTAYRAPHPSLPLLFTMLEEGGETQAQYFTDDNPIDEVDGTLTEANFTGYLELSENVLSGDYYVAYYGGRSLSAAFVGNTEQLITGNEAFERAVDEVGIYEVVDVDLEIHELPERSSSTAAASDTDQSGGATSPETDTETESQTPAQSNEQPAPNGPTASQPDPSTEEPDPEAQTPTAESEPDPDSDPVPDPDSEDPSPTTDPEPEPDSDGTIDEAEPTASTDREQPSQTTPEAAETPDSTPQRSESETRSEQHPTDQSETATSSQESAGAHDSSTPADSRDTSTQDSGDTDPTDTTASASQPTSPEQPQPSTDAETDSQADAESPFSEEEQWRETRDVPALDPSESESSGAQTPNGGPASPPQSNQPDTSTPQSEPEPAPVPNSDDQSGSTQSPDSGQPQEADRATHSSSSQSSEDSGPIRADNAETIRNLRSELEDRSSELDALREELATTQEERDQLKEERDRLKQRIQSLEADLEDARSQIPAETGSATTDMDPEEALGQTDIFIRYGSKGSATLEKAHQGEADKDEVTANLKLEHHTRFDADEVTVEGQPFDSFLEATMEYQFTKWIVEDLLFELQETGSHGKLQDLYDVLPRFDRSELRGTIELRNENDEEIHETFDIVVRDRMGQPLIVVTINDSRDPATSEMMETLIESANNVKFANDTLGGAVAVTASFFQPDALETASAATSSGLLSRDRRASFIKMSRKQGYHLCLVEARDGAFHVNVPEL